MKLTRSRGPEGAGLGEASWGSGEAVHFRGPALLAVISLTAVIGQRSAQAMFSSQDGLLWPTRDAVTGDNNERPCLDNDGSHLGYDMNVWGLGADDRWEPIYASAAGTVVQKVTSDFGFGNRLVLRHQIVPGSTTKYETFYAHLQDFASGIALTVKVDRGDLIGYMGDSGNADGVHLHFEIRRNFNDESSTVLGQGSSTSVDGTIGCLPNGARKNLTERTPMNLKLPWIKARWLLRNTQTAGNADIDIPKRRDVSGGSLRVPSPDTYSMGNLSGSGYRAGRRR